MNEHIMIRIDTKIMIQRESTRVVWLPKTTLDLYTDMCQCFIFLITLLFQCALTF